jgi:hypothetical protein
LSSCGRRRRRRRRSTRVFSKSSLEDDINLFSKLSVSVFEEFSNFSFDASLSFLFVGKLRGARKREFQVLYPSQTTLSIYTR